MGKSLRYFFAGLTAVLLLGAIVIGGWQAGWWFRVQNTNRQTQMLHQSYSYQSATAADLAQKIADINTETVQMDGVAQDSQQYADLHAQRLGEAQLACQDVAQLTTIQPAEAVWATANCLAGAVNPTSPLEG